MTRLPVRHEMHRGHELESAAGGHVYRAAAPATRPALDYTARIVPRDDGVYLATEAARILRKR